MTAAQRRWRLDLSYDGAGSTASPCSQACARSRASSPRPLRRCCASPAAAARVRRQDRRGRPRPRPGRPRGPCPSPSSPTTVGTTRRGSRGRATGSSRHRSSSPRVHPRRRLRRAPLRNVAELPLPRLRGRRALAAARGGRLALRWPARPSRDGPGRATHCSASTTSGRSAGGRAAPIPERADRAARDGRRRRRGRRRAQGNRRRAAGSHRPDRDVVLPPDGAFDRRRRSSRSAGTG